MQSRRVFGLALLLVVGSFLVGAIAAPSLPDRLVTHWGGSGAPNGTMAKWTALVFVPALGVLLLGLFAAIPRIDPLRENIAAFRDAYDAMVLVLAAFLAALHLVTIGYNLGYPVDVLAATSVGVAGLYYVLGVVLARAERNWFVGIRTPWTMSSDEVWARTHAIGSRLFKLCGVLALLGAIVPRYAIYVLVGPVLVTSLATVAYSYVVYERVERAAA